MAYLKKDIDKIKDKIINKVSLGESLKHVLDNNSEMPTRPIVYSWFNTKHNSYDEIFFNNYARARQDSADLDAETIQDIAEKTLKGGYDPAAARVAIDAYKWNASKKQPKRYGDKLDLSLETSEIKAIITKRKE